jgi:asparagine synthase (glutamine-hydrolysing)
VLVNDRFGLYPLYFSRIGDAFAFAPEIKGVLCAPNVARRLNQTAIAEYTRFQQLLGDKTWFEDVTLLPPASLLRYRPHDGQLTLERYWDWDAIGHQPAIDFDEAVDECIRLFQRAVDEMARPPRRVGVYLSGGLDGRTILGFLDQQAPPVTTITYGAPGCRDVVYAAELARRAGSRHHWFPLHDGRWILEQAPLHLALTRMHSWMHAHGMSTLPGPTLIDVIQRLGQDRVCALPSTMTDWLCA